jgi:tetratricopeptide (TPR) repeat protein
MLRKIILILALFATAQSQTLRVEIQGDLKDDSTKTKIPIIDTQVLLSTEKPAEVFCGPHTLKLSIVDPDSGKYALDAEIFGLGPEYYSAEYNLNLGIDDPMPLPPVPVKNRTMALYKITVLDDTSSIPTLEPAEDDTTAWGVSESIHYRTHWLKGSYADYNWNIWVGYLELVYDRYRYSYSISSSEKINIYFHPDPESSPQIIPAKRFSIFPRALRIDAVFGPEINSVTPQPGAELMIYRLWGYGPRWMTIGFSRYYSDDQLRMREIAGKVKVGSLTKLFAGPRWLESDTGQIVAGAFCHYLVDSFEISKFMELYRGSTELDFPMQFAKYYKQDFNKALSAFIEFSKKYTPKEGEIEYYASQYMHMGNFDAAAKYLEEGKNQKDLTLCKFWLGDYAGAAREIGFPNHFSPDCSKEVGIANYRLAAGEYVAQNNSKNQAPVNFFKSLTHDCPQAKTQLASMFLDSSEILEAQNEIDSIKIEDIKSPEFFIEAGRLHLMKGISADSLLTIAASIALEQISAQPQEPISYLYAGQAFMYLKDYDRAEENLSTAIFLEKRPFYQGCILIELGRLMDLQGRRDEAIDNYKQVGMIKAGAYQKYLADKYLANPYSIKLSGN